MLSLALDRKNAVLRITLSGALDPAQLKDLDSALQRFVARHGQMRSIVDLSSVDVSTISSETIIRRAQQAWVMNEAVRVYVATGVMQYGMCRMLVTHREMPVSVDPSLCAPWRKPAPY